ncbi:MAG: hypothetical protein ACREBS_05880 [Nitrososphaerales archaeon]
MMSSRFIGLICILLAIVVMALTMYVLIAPPAFIALPTIIIGVGTIATVIVLAAAIVWAR